MHFVGVLRGMQGCIGGCIGATTSVHPPSIMALPCQPRELRSGKRLRIQSTPVHLQHCVSEKKRAEIKKWSIAATIHHYLCNRHLIQSNASLWKISRKAEDDTEMLQKWTPPPSTKTTQDNQGGPKGGMHCKALQIVQTNGGLKTRKDALMTSTRNSFLKTRDFLRISNWQKFWVQTSVLSSSVFFSFSFIQM